MGSGKPKNKHNHKNKGPSTWEKVKSGGKKAWDGTWDGIYDTEKKVLGLGTTAFTSTLIPVMLPIVGIVVVGGIGLYFLTTRNQQAIVAIAGAAKSFSPGAIL